MTKNFGLATYYKVNKNLSNTKLAALKSKNFLIMNDSIK